MPKLPEKNLPKKPEPPRAQPVQAGMALGWDLSNVEDTYLLAELIRRGYRGLNWHPTEELQRRQRDDDFPPKKAEPQAPPPAKVLPKPSGVKPIQKPLLGAAPTKPVLRKGL